MGWFLGILGLFREFLRGFLGHFHIKTIKIRDALGRKSGRTTTTTPGKNHWKNPNRRNRKGKEQNSSRHSRGCRHRIQFPLFFGGIHRILGITWTPSTIPGYPRKSRAKTSPPPSQPGILSPNPFGNGKEFPLILPIPFPTLFHGFSGNLLQGLPGAFPSPDRPILFHQEGINTRR